MTQRQRRSLSHLGGPIESEGDEKACAILVDALSAKIDAHNAQRHVHGFHSYPAKMHPILARRLIKRLSHPHQTVLDPFCGSGTVLVESRLANRITSGSDLNPLAVLLARLKTRGASAAEVQSLLRAAHRVEQSATARRRDRAGSTRRYSQDDVRLFDPHVLLELDGLRDGVWHLRTGFAREALQLVLSSILTKVSRQWGDTGAVRDEPLRLASGFTIRLFLRKSLELSRRIVAYTSQLPAKAPAARVFSSDARELRQVKTDSIDLLVTSPPYPGTYDYLLHHQARLRWLELNSGGLDQGEIGARRTTEGVGHQVARQQFENEIEGALRAAARVLSPSGTVVLVIADSVVGGRALRARPLVRQAAAAASLACVATVAQPRPHFHRPSAHAFARLPKSEIIVLLRPGT